MLNFLCVMQQLSVKIKLNKVDLFYPNHPKGKVLLKESTRLKCSLQEAADWLKELGKSTSNFSTKGGIW